MLEGWSFGLIQWMVYGVASQELAPQEFDRYARICSASAGVGGCLSLLIGPFLFSIGGYFLPYFVLCGSFLILSLVIFMSGALDEKSDEWSKSEEDLMKWINCNNSSTLSEKIIDIKFILSVPVSTSSI